jgi:hypothetical protein
MAGKLEAVLSQAQKDSLDIEEFIFHIIEPEADDDEKVVYLDSVTLQEKQRTFFLDRLRDTAEGTQYVFQQDAVTLKEKCAQLVAPRADFNLLSRQITARLCRPSQGADVCWCFCRSHRSVPSDRTIAEKIGPSDQDGQ